jgi:hypothetical protein
LTSYRRRRAEIESSIEDHDEKTPGAMREYLDILDKVARIGVEGYTTVTVTIKGRPEELQDLADELKTWTPGPGWSPEAERLFKALEGEDV